MQTKFYPSFPLFWNSAPMVLFLEFGKTFNAEFQTSCINIILVIFLLIFFFTPTSLYLGHKDLHQRLSIANH